MPQAYFDNYALEYDAHFTASAVGIAQRKIVHSLLAQVLSKNSGVLEINCGTGEDAVFIASRCKEIICTDVSHKMTMVTGTKTRSLQNCHVITSSIQDLNKNTDKKFDVVFSNFGGLNCLDEAELKQFAKSSVALTNAGSDIVIVVMGRKCVWERLYFTFKREYKKASRRRDGHALATINGTEFSVYYYSPEYVVKLFAGDYKLVNKKPVGLFIPPSYLNTFFSRNSFVFSALCFFERVAGRFSFFSDYADHYLLHFKRK
jgi:SAM-dependent methyltransferase